MSLIRKFLGPRVPAETTDDTRRQYIVPTWLFLVAAALLLVSTVLPYWEMTLNAPQYPRGLHLTAYAIRLTGYIAEIDGLNHYIGMRPLAEAAQLERSVSVAAIAVLALLLLAAIFVHTRWAALLALPAILMPFLFLADMYFWMRNFGLNLDPRAPLSSAIKPFVPPILGTGRVGQFETIATFHIGLYLAFLAAGLIVAGLYAHRRAYKPLVEQSQ